MVQKTRSVGRRFSRLGKGKGTNKCGREGRPFGKWKRYGVI